MSKLMRIIFLSFFLLIAIIYDLKFNKIPNFLTFFAIFFGIIFNSVSHGASGLLLSIFGLSMGIGILLIFYLMGGMGAGDVKLMGAVGSFLGAEGVLYAILATSIIGGLHAILILIWSGDLKITFIRYWNIIKTSLVTKHFSYIPPPEKIKTMKMPYGVAIALGTIVVILLENISILGGLQ